jgi:hypothetical protein
MSGAVIRLPFDASGFAPSNQQVIGAVDVGDGHGRRSPEHQPARHLLGVLVDGARRVQVPRTERAHQYLSVEHVREQVGGRVAEVHGDCVAVLLQNRRQPLVDQCERLIPGGGRETSVGLPDQWR